MRKKVYTIIGVDPDDQNVVAKVIGPERPAISTLYKQFKQQYGWPEHRSGISAKEMMLRVNQKAHARTAMFKDGLNARTASEAFVFWLEVNHGFTKENPDVFYVEN